MISQTLEKKVKKLPEVPGVYFFLGRNRKVLYIGKATSLRDRVRSYFAKDISLVRSPWIGKMIEQAKSIDFRQTDSVLEALILEADLIKKFKPDFNTDEKDDKSFNCVVITDEEFPVIKLIRKKDIDFNLLESNGEKLKYVFGPYPESGSIKEALKIIRRIFPFRDDKCPGPNAKRPCFNATIKLCPGACNGGITSKEYKKTIRHIVLFFQGKKNKLISILKKEMTKVAKNEEFETAKEIRNQIFALEHIRDVSLLKKDSPLQSQETFRIESYDIAHTGGSQMVGVMTVMEQGLFKKSDYRKFIIRRFNKSNDTGALGEIIQRRLGHPEWPLPSVVIIDGGENQRKVGEKLFPKHIPVLSIVKDDAHKAREILGDKSLKEKYKADFINLNAETHRYAITFHRKRRGNDFIPSNR